MAFDPVAEQKFAKALVENLPASVRVGPYTFSIEKWSMHQASANQAFGLCSSNEQRISIQSEMPTRWRAVDTFIHELYHAIFYAYGIEDEDKEERAVGALGTAHVALYRDNPWLIDWIKSAKL